MRTGSLAELGVLAIFALLGVLMIPVAQLGPRRLLHLATASLPGAVRDAEDWGDEWQMEIAVEGYDVLNQKMVNARFPVVGRRDDGTIIIERQDAYWMLKKAGTEIYRIDPRHTRLYQVAPRTDQTRVVRVANLSLAALHSALTASLPDTTDPKSAHQILLTGTANCYPLAPGSAPGSAPADAPHFGLKTVQFNATRIGFDFAQSRHLATWPK